MSWPPETPEISVCIPAYNNVAGLERCIESVLMQKGVRFECIVSDDSKTDDVACLIRNYADQRIIYQRNSPPFGAPQNWNAAIAMSSGCVVTLLHHDDWYRSPHVLKEVRDIMAATDADVLVTGRARYAGEKCIGEYPLSPARLRKFIGGYPHRSLVINAVSSPSVLFFSQEHAGVRYDEELLYFSDTEYYARLFAVARRVEHLSAPAVAVEWGAPGQLSPDCLSRPHELVHELDYCLRKSGASGIDAGLALARFFASNLRSWLLGGLGQAIASAGTVFSISALFVAAGVFPVFCAHMAYRLTRRALFCKPWG